MPCIALCEAQQEATLSRRELIQGIKEGCNRSFTYIIFLSQASDMEKHNARGNLAVLIDGDNVPYKYIAGLMAEVATYGTASVRRVYGDWASPLMTNWRKPLMEHSITPIQQYAHVSGKNATDIALTIDAMDLLYTGRFSSFCLVSSDSDFTRLAARIREQGISVFGFGARNNTHNALVKACNEFVYFDALPALEDEAGDNAAASTLTRSTSPPDMAHAAMQPPLPSSVRHASASSFKAPTEPLSMRVTAQHRRPIDRVAIDAIRKAISNSPIYEQDFVNLAQIGHYLVNLSPDLNPRNYGYARLRDFIVASGVVEHRMKTLDNGSEVALGRLKNAEQKAHTP